MRGVRVLLAALAVLALLAALAPLQAVQILTIDTSQVSFIAPSAADYDSGHMELLSANTLTVESDIDWQLSVLGTTATWSCSGVGCWAAKPRADIEWRVSGGTYSPLTGTAVTVATGMPTSPGTVDVVIDYRILLDWASDTPGAYDFGSVQYQVSAL